jgi:hypothetical protein
VVGPWRQRAVFGPLERFRLHSRIAIGDAALVAAARGAIVAGGFKVVGARSRKQCRQRLAPVQHRRVVMMKHGHEERSDGAELAPGDVFEAPVVLDGETAVSGTRDAVWLNGGPSALALPSSRVGD